MAITMGQLSLRYKDAAAETQDVANKQLRGLSQVAAGLVRKSIQDMHAVDTATMLNSTTVDSTGKDTYLIGPTVDYAVYVALGTSRMAARPFHIQAANELRKQAGDFGFSAEELGL